MAVVFEYIDQQDADERANQRLRRVLAEEAPAIRDAVIQGFAFQPEDLARVTSTDTLDQVIENSLAIRFKDPELARDVYADLQAKVLTSDERCRDMNVTVTLAPWDDGPPSGPGSMFVATIRREYRVTGAKSIQRFSCVSDLNEYQELLGDPTTTEVWYFEPTEHLDAGSPGVFELLQFSVNGKERPIRRSKRTSARLYTVALGPATEDQRDEIVVAYTYRALVKRHGNLLHLDFGKPCKGVHIELRYADCGLDYVNVLSLLGNPAATRIERSPEDASPAITISRPGWALPGSGLIFVWTTVPN